MKTTNVVGIMTSVWSNTITTASPITVTFAGYSASTTSNRYFIFVYTVSKSNAIVSSGSISITFNVLLVGGGGSGGSSGGGCGGGAILQVS